MTIRSIEALSFNEGLSVGDMEVDGVQDPNYFYKLFLDLFCETSRNMLGSFQNLRSYWVGTGQPQRQIDALWERYRVAFDKTVESLCKYFNLT